MPIKKMTSVFATLTVAILITGNFSNTARADHPEFHGFYEITRHVQVEGDCGEGMDSTTDQYTHFHLEGNTVGQAGFDFDNYTLSYCTSADRDDCERGGRYTRFFEVQAEDRGIQEGILVDKAGGKWRERGGGICRFGWFRTVVERTLDGLRIRLLDEAVELDLSDYDGPCSASEETAHLLDGSCDEAQVLEGVPVSNGQDPDPAADTTARQTPDDSEESPARQTTPGAVTLDTSDEASMMASLEAMEEELGDALTQPMTLILMGYAAYHAREQGIEVFDPDQADALKELANRKYRKLDGMTAREIVRHVENTIDEELLRE